MNRHDKIIAEIGTGELDDCKMCWDEMERLCPSWTHAVKIFSSHGESTETIYRRMMNLGTFPTIETDEDEDRCRTLMNAIDYAVRSEALSKN